MPRVWISVGSNVDREANIRKAVGLLRSLFGELLISPVYRSRAVGFDGEDFYNLVLGLDTRQGPDEIKTLLRDIEDRCGRVRGEDKFSPRTMDLDLLTWGDRVDPAVPGGLPRDEILDYLFVLQPLADVAPEERHPVTGQRYVDILTRLRGRPGQQDLTPVAMDLG